jgi:hypothetical protein
MDQELVSDSLVYRYDPQASPDGLRGSEGTLTICSFWYVDALAVLPAGRRPVDVRENADVRMSSLAVLGGDRTDGVSRSVTSRKPSAISR